MDLGKCFRSRADRTGALPNDVSTAVVWSGCGYRTYLRAQRDGLGGSRPVTNGENCMNPGTGKYEGLFARCASLEPIPTAVGHPCEKNALGGALEAGPGPGLRSILVAPRGQN